MRTRYEFSYKLFTKFNGSFRCKVRVKFNIVYALTQVFTLFSKASKRDGGAKRSRNFIISSFESVSWNAILKNKCGVGSHYYSEGVLVISSMLSNKRRNQKPLQKELSSWFEMFQLCLCTQHSLYYEKRGERKISASKRKTLLEHVKPLFIWEIFFFWKIIFQKLRRW